MEKKKLRKEKAKTAAIIFLSVLLVLTFFSNTIHNFSLPEAAVVAVESGAVKTGVAGSGEIFYGEQQVISAQEAGVLRELFVKPGDYVNSSDVIGRIVPESGSEDELKKSIEELTEEFNISVIQNNITLEEVNALKGQSMTLEQMYNAVAPYRGWEKYETLKAHQLVLYHLSNLWQNILKQQEALALMEDETAGYILAEASGRVMETAQVMEYYHTGDQIAVIQTDADSGKLSFYVDQSRLVGLAVGMQGKITAPRVIKGVNARLLSIDTQTELYGQAQLTVEVEDRSVAEGTVVSVSLNQTTANYDTVVPNEAVRMDSGGDFLFVLQTKQTPLGNRYSARKVRIQVLAKDETYSAVIGDLYAGDFVITQTSRPIYGNDQVRLNQSLGE